jgi:hypothetical protein
MLFDKHDNLWLLTMDGAEYGEVNVMRDGRFYYYDVGIYGIILRQVLEKMKDLLTEKAKSLCPSNTAVFQHLPATE